MKTFLVYWLIFSFTVGIFCGFLVWNYCRSKWRWFFGITVMLLVGAILGGSFAIDTFFKENAFNNGYCKCGGKWELFDVEHIRNAPKIHYYKCPNCGKVIEI